MTKKELFKMMNNKKVQKEVLQGLTIENIPELEKELKELAKENNTKLIDNGNTWELENFNNIWYKPKIKKFSEGIFKVRNKDFIFLTEGRFMYSNIPKKEEMEILNNGFIHITRYGKIKYTIIN